MSDDGSASDYSSDEIRMSAEEEEEAVESSDYSVAAGADIHKTHRATANPTTRSLAALESPQGDLPGPQVASGSSGVNQGL